MKHLFYLSVFAIVFFSAVSCDDTSESNNEDTVVETEETSSAKPSEVPEDEVATSSSSEEESADITSIMKICSNIDGNLNKDFTYEKRRYVDDSQPGNYFQIDFDVYNDVDGNVAKFLIKGGEEGFYSETTYYFNHGDLVLIFNQDFNRDDLYNQSSIYYKEGMFLALQKSKAEDDEETDLTKVEYSQHPDFVKDRDAFVKKQDEVIERYFGFLEKSEVVTD